MPNKKIKYLDKEEKKLIESFNDIDINKVKSPTAKRQLLLKNAAKIYLKASDAHLHIRINSEELELIKKKASKQGLTYSSFIKSILHKYITGQLQEKNI